MLEVAIVGAGFSGLAAGARLKREGQDSFVILEKADEVGGTWRDNTYPGCACDVKSNLYSFSFAPSSQWSRLYAPQPEILTYLKECSHSLQLREHIRFRSAVVRASFQKQSGSWLIELQDGGVLEARVLVLAPGPLSRPSIPDIPGLESFRGPVFHSARWDHSVDLVGKRVAVIGTGASAIQVVPAIAEKVKSLYLFQRSAAYVVPRKDRAIGANVRKWLDRLPFLQQIHRFMVYAYNELLAGPAVYSSEILNRLARAMALRHMKRAIKDPALRRQLTPDYRIGCKRILISDDYYPALARDNVQVIQGEVDEVAADSVLSHDLRCSVEVIVLCTGFHVSDLHRNLGMEIQGLDEDLAQYWERQGLQAHRGSTVSGFPNLFLYLGPNTGLGHNSMVHIMESQSNYLVSYLKTLQRHPGCSLNVRSDSQYQFNQRIQKRMQRTSWTSGGCHSWYLDEHGRNTTLWPGSTLSYRKETKKLDENEYELVWPDAIRTAGGGLQQAVTVR